MDQAKKDDLKAQPSERLNQKFGRESSTQDSKIICGWGIQGWGPDGLEEGFLETTGVAGSEKKRSRQCRGRYLLAHRCVCFSLTFQKNWITVKTRRLHTHTHWVSSIKNIWRFGNTGQFFPHGTREWPWVAALHFKGKREPPAPHSPDRAPATYLTASTVTASTDMRWHLWLLT